jgi:4-hydroxybenzoate polyprenyltransferase
MHTDIKPYQTESWIFNKLPPAWRPYFLLTRLDRPIGFWLLAFPCWWSLALGGAFSQDISLFFIFGVGSLLMRSAGCIYNDILDRKLDASVERTRLRPLAQGTVSLKAALIFLVCHFITAFILLLHFNIFTITLGISALILIGVYPLMKRITYWPQAFLGLTFNWGSLMAWTSFKGHFSWSLICLYTGGVFWTLGYDTVYAHQDKEDDLRIGIKSTALKFGSSTKIWLYGFYGLALIFWDMAGRLEHLSFWHEVFLGGAAYLLFKQVALLDINNPSSCLKGFQENAWVAFMVFLGFGLGHL